MSANIPQTPHSVIDTRLDGPAALTLAEQVLAAPTKLASAFRMQRVQAEITGRHPTGFTYRSHIHYPLMRMRMNDGYVVAQDNGQGGTRVSFHESKRWAMIFGAMVVGAIALYILAFIFADKIFYEAQTAQTYTPSLQYRQAQDSNIALISMISLGVFAAAMIAWQGWEQLTMPKRLAQRFAAFANGGGQPGHPPAQPGYPAQPQQQPQPQASWAPPPIPTAAPVQLSVADRLRQLAELRDSGALTTDMYERSKAAILSEVS